LTRRFVALLAVALLAACGSDERSGTATLWVTREAGQRVLLTAEVAAGQSAMQALDRESELETRYGGRFVQAVNGVAGSLGRGFDWFYFVNGYEGDRSAAEYRLRDGDVVWFDYRSWREQMRLPVVVGSFPEPFLHGYAGKRRGTAVRYSSSELEPDARAVARLLAADSVEPDSTPVPQGVNSFVLVARGPMRLTADPTRLPARPGEPVAFLFSGDGTALAADPSLVRFRYRYP
jgi:hypothetical protein